MPLSLQLIKAAGFRSCDALAKQVCDRWDPKQKHRSVAIKLGELIKGKDTWWRKRPEAVEVLARELNVDPEELVPRRSDSTALYPFAAFPQLRGFDPRREDVCRIGNEGWFDPIVRERCRWIHAPAGTGKSFAAYVHRHRHGTRTVSVTVLADALAEAEAPGPLVIEIEQAQPDSDKSIEQKLIDRGSVAVLAPFPCRAAVQGMQVGAGAYLDGGESSGGPIWPEALTWTPTSGWRELFVSWLVGRVEQGVQFRVDELLKWLQREDPHLALFTTPTDLLALCAFAHDVGGKSWSRQVRSTLAARWLGARFAQKDPRASHRDPWLELHGRDAVRALVGNWFRSPRPWREPLSREHWIELMPEAATGSGSEVVEPHLQEMVALPSKRSRDRKKAEVLALLDTPNKESAFTKLGSARILQPEAAGKWSFRPAWVANLLAREMTTDAFRGPAQQWGRWAVEPDRRGLIDALLDELSPEDLLALSQRAVTGFQPSSLGAIAAVEALFAAVGRRLARDERLDTASFLPLWELQRTTLTKRYMNGAPVPLTRPALSDPGAIEHEWLELCWSWSFALKGSHNVSAGHEWLVPGWTRPSLSSIASWVLNVEGSWRLVELGKRLIASCEEQELPPRLPVFLLIPCVIEACRRGWPMSSDHLQALMTHRVALERVTTEVEKCSAEESRRLAGALWRSCQEPGKVNFYVQERPAGVLRAFVDKHLSEEDFRATLGNRRIGEVASSLAYVPARFRVLVAEEALRQFPDLGHTLLDQKQGLNTEVLELLLARMEPRWLVIKKYWQISPSAAFEHTIQALKMDSPEAVSWIFEAPSESEPRLLALLEEHAQPLQDWVDMWLARKLLRGGPDAERIHALQRRFRELRNPSAN